MRALQSKEAPVTTTARARAAQAASITTSHVSVLREETEALLKERELFLRAQQLDLKRAAKDMLNLQTRSVDAFRTQLAHAEERYSFSAIILPQHFCFA